MAEDSERDDALFVNLVLIFQSAAMQQMGKIINPLTGKIDRNLEQARFSIDTLSMLREKTKGNLSSDIERLLDSALLQLRMNFVDESRAAAESPLAGSSYATDESRSPEKPRSATASASEESQTETDAGSSSGGGSSQSTDVKAPAERPAQSDAGKPAESGFEPSGTKRPRASGISQAGKTRRKGRAGGAGGRKEAADR